jgi:tellurite resistance protein TerC
MEKMTPWIILISYILVLLLIDFFVLHKKNQKPSTRKAVFETLFFIANALVFSIVVYWLYSNSHIDNVNNLTPSQSVVKYLTGYIIELSLSVDNLFVIAIIFTSFKIPVQHQHKLLFLGILGAIIFRALLISVGLVLLSKVHGMNIVFGLFLLFTAFKMLKNEEEPNEIKEDKGIRNLFRFSKEMDGGKFMTQVNGKTVFTALFGALVTIELTDLLFALDSIPAIFAVTTDPYLVYSSNIFAIMGLRSLYFFLSTMLEKFHYIKYSVFAILLFVALKLITVNWIKIPEWFSLVFIGISLAIGVWVSFKKVEEERISA